MSSPEYTALPTDERSSSAPDRIPSYRDDPRFVDPKPATWKRVGLVLFIIFLFWGGYKLREMALSPQEDVIVHHTGRYSDEHKFRPAASPILRRRLPDGRIEVRGDYHQHVKRTEL